MSSILQYLSSYFLMDDGDNHEEIDFNMINDLTEDVKSDCVENGKKKEYKFILFKNDRIMGYTDSVDNIPELISTHIKEDKQRFGSSYSYSTTDKISGVVLKGRMKNNLLSYDRVLSTYIFVPITKLD